MKVFKEICHYCKRSFYIGSNDKYDGYFVYDNKPCCETCQKYNQSDYVSDTTILHFWEKSKKNKAKYRIQRAMDLIKKLEKENQDLRTRVERLEKVEDARRPLEL